MHGLALLVRLELVIRWGLQQRPQDRVGRGMEVVQEALGNPQLGLREFVDQSM